MLYHVKIQYCNQCNPTTNPEQLQQLVDFAEWMQYQTTYEVKTASVYWGTEQACGYGVFESTSKSQLRGFLGRMPGEPTLTISSIEELSEAVSQGHQMLAERRA